MLNLTGLSDTKVITPSDYKILTEAKDPVSGTWECTIETPLQELNSMNNNGRVYTKELMEPVIQSIQPLVRERHLVGELGHPVYEAGSMGTSDGYIRRIGTIDPLKMSHMITKIWIDGNIIMGHVKTLHTDAGRNLTNFILLDKGTIGFSLRAIGTTERKNGVEVVSPKGFVFVTYDAVINPSNRIAKFNPNTMEFKHKTLIESSDPLSASNNSKQICVNGICELQESLCSSDISETAKLTAARQSLIEGLEYLKNIDNLDMII